MKTKETLKPGRMGIADAALWPSSRREGAQKKKGSGGRRKSLKRLDSAKEMQGFSSLYFGRALPDEARIWLD